LPYYTHLPIIDRAMNMIQILIMMISLSPILVKGQRHSVFIQGDIRFSDSSLSVQEAGLNVTSSIHTEKAVLVSVEYTGSPENNPNFNWRVYVHMQDIEWDDSFRLEIKRTGSGRNKNNAGNPKINDGQVFQEL